MFSLINLFRSPDAPSANSSSPLEPLSTTAVSTRQQEQQCDDEREVDIEEDEEEEHNQYEVHEVEGIATQQDTPVVLTSSSAAAAAAPPQPCPASRSRATTSTVPQHPVNANTNANANNIAAARRATSPPSSKPTMTKMTKAPTRQPLGAMARMRSLSRTFDNTLPTGRLPLLSEQMVDLVEYWCYVVLMETNPSRHGTYRQQLETGLRNLQTNVTYGRLFSRLHLTALACDIMLLSSSSSSASTLLAHQPPPQQQPEEQQQPEQQSVVVWKQIPSSAWLMHKERLVLLKSFLLRRNADLPILSCTVATDQSLDVALDTPLEQHDMMKDHYQEVLLLLEVQQALAKLRELLEQILLVQQRQQQVQQAPPPATTTAGTSASAADTRWNKPIESAINEYEATLRSIFVVAVSSRDGRDTTNDARVGQDDDDESCVTDDEEGANLTAAMVPPTAFTATHGYHRPNGSMTLSTSTNIPKRLHRFLWNDLFQKPAMATAVAARRGSTAAMSSSTSSGLASPQTTTTTPTPNHSQAMVDNMLHHVYQILSPTGQDDDDSTRSYSSVHAIRKLRELLIKWSESILTIPTLVKLGYGGITSPVVEHDSDDVSSMGNNEEEEDKEAGHAADCHPPQQSPTQQRLYPCDKVDHQVSFATTLETQGLFSQEQLLLTQTSEAAVVVRSPPPNTKKAPPIRGKALRRTLTEEEEEMKDHLAATSSPRTKVKPLQSLLLTMPTAGPSLVGLALPLRPSPPLGDPGNDNDDEKMVGDGDHNGADDGQGSTPPMIDLDKDREGLEGTGKALIPMHTDLQHDDELSNCIDATSNATASRTTKEAVTTTNNNVCVAGPTAEVLKWYEDDSDSDSDLEQNTSPHKRLAQDDHHFDSAPPPPQPKARAWFEESDEEELLSPPRKRIYRRSNYASTSRQQRRRQAEATTRTSSSSRSKHLSPQRQRSSSIGGETLHTHTSDASTVENRESVSNDNDDDDHSTSSPIRTYSRFTKEETAAIREGVIKHGPGKWIDMIHDDERLKNRTNIQIKDRFRTMLQRGEIPQSILYKKVKSNGEGNIV